MSQDRNVPAADADHPQRLLDVRGTISGSDRANELQPRCVRQPPL